MATWTRFSSETRFPISRDLVKFPFKCELSLAPLITTWSEALSGDRQIAAKFHRHVLEEVQNVPELLAPIDDLAVLDRHRELVNVLMTHVFPPASWPEDYAAAMFPFQFRTFYATPSFERLLSDADGMLRGQVNLDAPVLTSGRILNAYTLILRKYYGVELGFDYPIIITIEDPQTRLERHFRLYLDREFVEVEAVGKVRPLTGDEQKRVLANRADPDVLMAIVPPDQFVFHGFGVLKATDVTDQEVLSSLKRDLIDKYPREAIIDWHRKRGLLTP